jgi:8-oxo-dGTP pyrophosphatase MutT (NUDIX family)
MDQHLGVIFLLLSPNRKATFLLNHKKAQLWLPPGGHVDRGLSFQEAVNLEMVEEIGYEPIFISTRPVFLTKVLTRGLNAGHIDVTAWFLVEGDPNLNYHVLEKEAAESRWADIDELAKMPDYSNLPRLYTKIILMEKQGLLKTTL